MNEKCPCCEEMMKLNCNKEKIYSNEYVYWWECSECGRVYDYNMKTLLFIKR